MEVLTATHRPGLLKQQNKLHKHGRHRSKGAIDKAMRGKMSEKVLTKKVRRDLRKEERRHQAVQLRLKKRDEVLFKKRSLGGTRTAPFLIAVIPLSCEVDPVGCIELLKQCDSEAVISGSSEGNFHISLPRFKQRFSLVVPAVGDLYSVLDALKVADTVLFVVSAVSQSELDPAGEVLLTAAMAQGLPSTVVALTHLDSIHPKKRHDVKQRVQKTISRWLPDEKVLSLESYNDGLAVLRRIGSQKQRSVTQRDRRPHMLAEVVDYAPDMDGPLGTLRVSGYIRGQPLSVHSLVHIPGWGDFQMSHITAPSDPHPLGKNVRDGQVMDSDMIEEDRLLEQADPARQESLVSENIPDPMDAEQTWPTAEELKDAEDERKAKKLVKKIPKGMSDYQAAWIPDCDAEEADVSDDEAGEMAMDARSESMSDEDPEEQSDIQSVTVTEGVEDEQRYDEKMDLAEEKEMLQKLKDARTDQMFPDEVDTPMDTPARIRFQKYRGLQSFRTSPWDPKENLPFDYARIFQFENFDRTRKRVLKDMEEREGALPGWYVKLHIKGVPQFLVQARRPDHPLVLYGMLPHEQKISLLNVVLKQPSCITHQPIKSKEQLVFHCGYRRFRACPIFSQHTNGSKHKYERYFQPDATVVASMFAPIMFPPCSVIAFKEKEDGTQDLVATGSVLSVNPDRIVAKRVVLSGHPFKVHKRSAVVRFMFFNREDIDWFKPVELRTKYGRRGHIREPLGTHGHMKCVFDGQLKSQDTVLMCLYKRVFPKWTYEPYLESPRSLFKK
ncbi:pre-rRNA-processing protein TSR1 homolog [Anabrus simplex]|uniref:pre-rRNA-processing protein TSR1 homolog n=1 Tax=Anabrus simplex TaxID=316456 RepID=UPI0035A37440